MSAFSINVVDKHAWCDITIDLCFVLYLQYSVHYAQKLPTGLLNSATSWNLKLSEVRSLAFKKLRNTMRLSYTWKKICCLHLNFFLSCQINIPHVIKCPLHWPLHIPPHSRHITNKKKPEKKNPEKKTALFMITSPFHDNQPFMPIPEL